MAYNPTTGQWTPDDTESASVAKNLTGLMSVNSPIMKQATTQGLAATNRRGLMNSSIGTQAAQSAAYQTMLPIASQDAQQAQQRILQGGQFAHETAQQQRAIESDEKMKYASIASYDREKAASMATAMENAYAEMYRTIAQADQLPAEVRDKYLAHAGKVRDSSMALVEQMYNIELQWETPTV